MGVSWMVLLGSREFLIICFTSPFEYYKILFLVFLSSTSLSGELLFLSSIFSVGIFKACFKVLFNVSCILSVISEKRLNESYSHNLLILR